MTGCPYCRRKESLCLECLTGQLLESTLNCSCRHCRRRVRDFPTMRPWMPRPALSQSEVTSLRLAGMSPVVGRATSPSSVDHLNKPRLLT
jgi:hypothetical protein